ncbi:oxepin-CoA hydrolase, alternative type [Puniceibacterium sediminis]|uniref:Enoyl-CoA hydratase n=1 Tax=Puniceibacterium sediminis TaxID=1608407 RepID=A0A238UZ25_9RHOB|nr:enoyl-CoA hydratase family protein [Puniceibacterium sediminis]SNR27480.1 Enoyl-CoA hydratase [Puniceibacterium sediminis]
MTKRAYVEDLGDRLVVVNSFPERRNPLGPDLYTAILEATGRAATEARITSVTLWGTGGFFCAGGDLNTLSERRNLSLDELGEQIEELHDVIRSLRTCPKPVIAAVDGGAAGAGVSLAFACDFILAAEDAKFTAAYVSAGLVPDGGLTSTLSDALPRAMVARMTLLGEPVAATRLYDLGAVYDVTPPLGTREAALALGDRIAAGPTVTIARIKALLGTARHVDLKTQMDHERDAMAVALGSDEAREGMGAFLEKRRPDFKTLRERE